MEAPDEIRTRTNHPRPKALVGCMVGDVSPIFVQRNHDPEAAEFQLLHYIECVWRLYIRPTDTMPAYVYADLSSFSVAPAVPGKFSQALPPFVARSLPLQSFPAAPTPSPGPYAPQHNSRHSSRRLETPRSPHSPCRLSTVSSPSCWQPRHAGDSCWSASVRQLVCAPQRLLRAGFVSPGRPQASGADQAAVEVAGLPPLRPMPLPVTCRDDCRRYPGSTIHRHFRDAALTKYLIPVPHPCSAQPAHTACREHRAAPVPTDRASPPSRIPESRALHRPAS